MAKTLKSHIKKELAALLPLSPDELVDNRIEKYSRMGNFAVNESIAKG